MNIFKFKINYFYISISCFIFFVGIFSLAQDDGLLYRLKYLVIPIGFVFAIILIYHNRIEVNYLLKLSISVVLLIFFGFFSGGFNLINERSIIVICFILGNFFIAKLIVDRKIAYSVSVFVYCMAILVVLNYIAGSRQTFQMSSYNAFGSLLVFSCSMLTAASKYEKSKNLIYPSLIGLFLSVFLIGRSTIIAMSIILLCALIDAKRKKFLILTLLLYPILNIFINLSLFDFLIENTRLRIGLVDVARYEIWSAYISRIDVFSLAFGLPPKDVPFIHDFWYDNPHNSFFDLFGFFGLYPFLLFAFWIFVSDWSRFNFVGIGCLTAIIFRSATDAIIVGRPFDLFFWIVFLLVVNTPNSKYYFKNIIHYKPGGAKFVFAKGKKRELPTD